MWIEYKNPNHTFQIFGKIFVYHGKYDGSDTHPPYFKIYVGVLIGKNYRRFFLYNDGQKSGLIHNNVWTNVSL